MAEATLAALDELPTAVRDRAQLAFTTHSIPLSMAESSGAPDDPARGTPGGAYVAQHLEVARLVAEAVAEATGVADRPWELVYQSRSGAPHIPWLEPDICDHLETLSAAGAAAAVMIPIGLRLRPHGGQVRPRHRGGAGRRAVACRWPARPPRARTRVSSP